MIGDSLRIVNARFLGCSFAGLRLLRVGIRRSDRGAGRPTADAESRFDKDDDDSPQGTEGT